jgi:sugar phosphate isomerase/epimerase
MKWDIGVSTGIAYRHPIEDVLPMVQRHGFRAIEVSTAPAHLDIAAAARVRALRLTIDDLGLRVHSLHAPFGHDVNFTSPDPDQRRDALHRLTLAADALLTLGGRLYVIHPGGEDQRWAWDRDRRLALSVEGLNRVWQTCQERGLTLVVETPLPHLLGGQPADFAWILERLPRDGTGVCVDTSHCGLGGTLPTAIAAAGRRLVHVQASDNRGHTDDHLPPGTGVIDWRSVEDALVAADYQGTFMLEVAGDDDVEQCLSALGTWKGDQHV